VSPLKTPGALIFFRSVSAPRTRSAHLLCTLTTTPLPAALLAIATRGAELAHLLLFTKHGNTVTSVRLSHVYHLSTDNRSTANGISGKLNLRREIFRIDHNNQRVLLPSEALGGVIWSEGPTASIFRKNFHFRHNVKFLTRQMSSQPTRQQYSRSRP